MTIPQDRFWAKVLFKEFIHHFRKLDDSGIVADIKQSMDDLDDLNDNGTSFGSKMVRWSVNRKNDYPMASENGKKGGRPSLNSQGKSAPDTLSPNANGGSCDTTAEAQSTTQIAVVENVRTRRGEPLKAISSGANVWITESEAKKLAAEFGDFLGIAEELSDYLRNHPNKYKDHYATLRAWCRRRIAEGAKAKKQMPYDDEYMAKALKAAHDAANKVDVYDTEL